MFACKTLKITKKKWRYIIKLPPIQNITSDLNQSSEYHKYRRSSIRNTVLTGPPKRNLENKFNFKVDQFLPTPLTGRETPHQRKKSHNKKENDRRKKSKLKLRRCDAPQQVAVN